MTGLDWLLVAATAVLFLASIWLALVETAFTRMSRVRALALEDEGRRGAGRLARMLEHPERTLNVVYLLALFCQLTTGSLVGFVLSRVVGPWGFAIGIVVQFVVFFVVGEVAPKTYALQHTDGAVLRNSGLLAFLSNFPPLRWASRSLIGLANLIIPGRQPKEGPYVSEEEIRTMADVAAEEEAIERDERRLIHSIFEFGDMVVREAMTPRTDMVAIDADATIEDGITAAIEGGFSRIPAYEGSTDNIIGLVFLKDLVALARASKRNEPVRTALREAEFVPEQKRVAELLREMQTKQFHMAIVIDEYGGTSGLVTLEDLLEEIVGDIADEYDVEEPSVEHLPGGALRVPGGTSIDDVSDELGVELPDTEWDTVGGLVFNLLGHVPEEGECVRFQGLEFRTERVKGRRIVSVHIRPAPNAAAEPVAAQ
jgi:CBS domain containing-hemolysin-like protein